MTVFQRGAAGEVDGRDGHRRIGRKHQGGRLRIEVDIGVVVIENRWLNGVLREGAEIRDRAVALEAFRVLFQGPGQIGERADRDQIELARAFLAEPHQLIDCRFPSDLSDRFWQADIAQSVVAMHLGSGMRGLDRAFRPERHGNGGHSDGFQGAQGVSGRIGRGAIAVGRADGDHLHLRFGEEIEDHQRIVDAHIDIEHDRNDTHSYAALTKTFHRDYKR